MKSERHAQNVEMPDGIYRGIPVSASDSEAALVAPALPWSQPVGQNIVNSISITQPD